MSWIIGFIVIAVVVGVLAEVGKSKAETQVANALQVIPNFAPELIYRGKAGRAGLAIDTKTNRFAIGTNSSDVKVFNFSQLVSVEVLKNGTSISKTNRGSQVAGAAIGAVLLGPIGLLLGGLTGSKRSVEKIDKLSLKIYTDDLLRPANEIVFFDMPKTKPDSILVKAASEELDTWFGRFQTIMHKNSTHSGS